MRDDIMSTELLPNLKHMLAGNDTGLKVSTLWVINNLTYRCAGMSLDFTKANLDASLVPPLHSRRLQSVTFVSDVLGHAQPILSWCDGGLHKCPRLVSHEVCGPAGMPFPRALALRCILQLLNSDRARLSLTHA